MPLKPCCVENWGNARLSPRIFLYSIEEWCQDAVAIPSEMKAWRSDGARPATRRDRPASNNGVYTACAGSSANSRARPSTVSFLVRAI